MMTPEPSLGSSRRFIPQHVWNMACLSADANEYDHLAGLFLYNEDPVDRSM